MSTRTDTWRTSFERIAITLLLPIAVAVWGLLQPVHAAAPVAKVLVMQGGAEISHDGSTRMAERYAPVPLGATITTPVGSAIGIEFPDGSYLSIGDLSSVRIEAVEPVYWNPGNPMRVRVVQERGVSLVDTSGARSSSVRITVQSGAASTRIQRGQVRVENLPTGLVACLASGKGEVFNSKAKKGIDVPAGECRIAGTDGSVATWTEADVAPAMAEAAPAVEIPTPVAVVPSAPVVKVPASAPVPSSKAPDVAYGGNWAVVLFSLVNKNRAEAAVERLTQDGYAAEIRVQKVSGVTRYRVLLPGMAAKSDAQAMRSAVKSDLGIRDAWLLQEQ